jgi:biopolymer transport protein ExbD
MKKIQNDMAEIIEAEKSDGGKKRPKKHGTHIDMTPMVDLMCLLIVFFMLTSAFSKPKVMDIALPEKIKDPNTIPQKIPGSRTVNIILGPDNRIFWYPGTVNEEDYNNLPPLAELSYGPTGIRAMLLDRNIALARKIENFRDEVLTGKIDIRQDSVAKASSALKSEDDTGPIVLIKAYEEATYGNFVDILDEMNICGIARYAFVDITWYEIEMVKIAVQATAAIASSGN